MSDKGGVLVKQGAGNTTRGEYTSLIAELIATYHFPEISEGCYSDMKPQL